jgi:hypothetical protein
MTIEQFFPKSLNSSEEIFIFYFKEMRRLWGRRSRANKESPSKPLASSRLPTLLVNPSSVTQKLNNIIVNLSLLGTHLQEQQNSHSLCMRLAAQAVYIKTHSIIYLLPNSTIQESNCHPVTTDYRLLSFKEKSDHVPTMTDKATRLTWPPLHIMY